MNDGLRYPWQQTLLDAFTASPADLPAKISIAERAIGARLKDNAADPAEMTALRDALTALRVLIAETTLQTKRANPRDQKKDIA